MSDIWKTRNTLLIRAQDKNDEQAWGDFVKFYTPYIEIILKKMRLFHESDDLIQEILIKIWKYLQSYDRETHKTLFRTWLSKIVHNTSLTYLQKKRKELNTFSIHEDSDMLKNHVEQNDIEKVIDREWQLYLTKTALMQIKHHFSDNAIQCFERSLKHETSQEISESLGITQASVRTLKNRVKIRMLEEIKSLKEQMEIS